jgi:hypothetical protein
MSRSLAARCVVVPCIHWRWLTLEMDCDCDVAKAVALMALRNENWENNWAHSEISSSKWKKTLQLGMRKDEVSVAILGNALLLDSTHTHARWNAAGSEY